MSTQAPHIKDTNWKYWLVENIFRGVPADYLQAHLVKQGLSASSVQHELNALNSNQAFQAAANYVHAVRRIKSLQDRAQKLAAYRPTFEIQRRSGVTVEEFYRNYYASGTPVILTDVTKAWPALQKWTPEYLRETVGDARIQIMTGRNADPQYEKNKDAHMSEVSMKTYVDMVLQHGPTNDFYMVARNRNLEKDGLQPLLADFQPLPAIMSPDSRPDSFLMWFGPAGTVTPLHHDPNGVFFCQVYGRKRYWMVRPDELSLLMSEDGYYSPVNAADPDLRRFPDFEGARVHTFDVGPGDAVFLPMGWWHQVESLDVSISVTLDEFRKPEQVS